MQHDASLNAGKMSHHHNLVVPFLRGKINAHNSHTKKISLGVEMKRVVQKIKQGYFGVIFHVIFYLISIQANIKFYPNLLFRGTKSKTTISVFNIGKVATEKHPREKLAPNFGAPQTP